MEVAQAVVLFDHQIAKLESDCACSTEVSSTQHTDHTKEEGDSLIGRPMRFKQVSPESYISELPHNFMLVYSPYLPFGPVVLNAKAQQRWQDFAIARQLTQVVDYDLFRSGLLTAEEDTPGLNFYKSDCLTAWLHITNACNLDCPYCYVRKSNEHMSSNIGLKVLNDIFHTAQKNQFGAVKLKYAGGEATLHFELVKMLHNQARIRATKAELDLQAIVLSNGTTWTSSMAEWLVNENVKLMISVDGIQEAHDTQRPRRGGKGSFAKIEYTVDHILLPAGVRPTISITITGLNASKAYNAVAWAIDRDLPFSLNFYRENLQSAKYADLKLEEEVIIDGMLKAYAEVEKRLPSRPFFSGLLDRVQLEPHTHTCGVGQNYLVFSHTGKVSQCQMDLAHSIPLAHTNDALSLVSDGNIPVIHVDDKEGCRDCHWRYLCTGGCPLETYRATNRFDIQSPHCHIYTTLFPEAMRLEGLRLLKMKLGNQM